MKVMAEKKMYQIEYTFNTSPKVLYYRLSTPSGLSEWFADDVNLHDGVLTFIWNDSEEQAEILSKKDNHFIKYRWLEDENEDTYFEFRIVTDELTGDVALHITDFIEEEEQEDSIELWNSQIGNLKHSLGL